MIYRDYKGEKLSLLGFGAMRLPLTSEEPGAPVDEAQVEEMVAIAMANGINYFDTAYPYHGGMSERIMGKILKKYPRENFCLADKYPGHQIAKTYDPAATFQEQLDRCQVEYFDYYLLHNIYEKSMETYVDPKWGIIDYFVEQKKLGRIRHLGFSCHGEVEMLRDFLDRYGDVMEFCQIQLNYLDWTMQRAKEKYDLLTERGIGVWVMEPVRGGRLANLREDEEQKLKAMRPEDSSVSWCFRFLQELPNVHMILSGMSNVAQMKDNIATFAAYKNLNEAEKKVLMDVAEGMKKNVPCTACRYCCEGCPKGLNIPVLLANYNDHRFAPNFNIAMRMEGLPEDKKPSACIGCGKCTKVCPQKIDIPGAMKAFAAELEKMPSWEEICRQRAAANEANSKKD